MSKLTHSTGEGMDAIDLRRATEDGNEDLLPPMTDLERGPSSDGESAICATSLSKPSSLEGLNAGERRAQLRALLHGINEKIGMRDHNWWDVAAEIVNEEIEALARHPSFNDAIEAAYATCLMFVEEECVLDAEPDPQSVAELSMHRVGLAIRDRINCVARSLKLPDYRGGEAKIAESNHSPSTREG